MSSPSGTTHVYACEWLCNAVGCGYIKLIFLIRKNRNLFTSVIFFCECTSTLYNVTILHVISDTPVYRLEETYISEIYFYTEDFIS